MVEEKVRISKKIARNTAFMYFRMLIIMLISFYSSRLILQQLGVTDYGIYNVVGSIVCMFNSLRAMFSSSTQRFLSYETGVNSNKEHVVFNTSLRINIVISIIFLILAEFIGLWFLNNKINIDPTRLYAAKVIFQISILTSISQIILTTYDALIIAHEKMQFYARLSIFEAILKLTIVFLLTKCVFDKLITYSILVLIVSLIILLINILYCWKAFPESHPHKLKDTSYFKKMLAFSGWNFLGNTAFALSQNLQNLVLNIFGGPLLNAARGLAGQVNGSLLQIIANINIVISPYCIKSYASGNKESLMRMFYLSSKILFLVQLCIVIFVTFLTDFILSIWLEKIPDYTVIFLKLTMVYSLVRSVHGPIDTLFKAYGNLKYYQISEGVILFFPVIIGYFVLYLGAPYFSIYIVTIICELFNLFSILFIAHNLMNLSLRAYCINVMFPCIVTIIPCVVFYSICSLMNISILLNISITLVTIVLALVLMWLCGLNRFEKEQILSVFKKGRY